MSNRQYFAKPVDTGSNYLQKNTIYEDVTFESIQYVKRTSKDGRPYEGLELTFSKTIDNETYKHSELIMPVNEAWANGDEELLDEMYNNLNRKLMHIASAVGLDTEKLAEKLAAPTFEGSAMKFAAVIRAKVPNMKFYLKLFNSKGYAALPRFPKFLQEQKEGSPCMLNFTEWEQKAIAKDNDAPTEGNITQADEEEAAFDDLDL